MGEGWEEEKRRRWERGEKVSATIYESAPEVNGAENRLYR
jgi:hypothetical protein